jgi:hypothetical protein
MSPSNEEASATAETVPGGQTRTTPKGCLTNNKSKHDGATLLGAVAELFPQMFTAERWQPHKPLKIGIDADLITTGILRPFEVGQVLHH